MTTQTQAAPVAEAQNTATELLTNESTEVVTPVDEATKESPESEESKALKRMQRRIDKRTADVYRERAEKDQLAQRIAELERRQQAPQGQEQPLAVDDKAIEAIALTKAQEIAQQQRFQETVQGVLKAGKSLPEFDKACNTLNEELPFYERNGKPTAFLSAVLDFDAPAQLLHHLGSNPDLASELADLTPTRLVRRLDAIERELTDKAKPKTSSAPKPLEPVKGQGGDAKDPSAMTDAEFAAWRKRQIAQRR